MLASQQAEVLQRCQSQGLDLRQFGWRQLGVSASSREQVVRLVHSPTTFFFEFGFNSKRQLSIFSPGQNWQKETHQAKDWDERYHQVTVWAGYLAREIRAQDLVASLMSEPPLEISTLPQQGNRPFDDKERELVVSKLEVLERHVIEMKELAASESETIKGEFETLRIEAKRASRNAWIRMLVGTVIAIGRSFFTHDQALAIWHFTEEHFAPVVRALTHHQG